jgi:hypothetical protein
MTSGPDLPSDAASAAEVSRLRSELLSLQGVVRILLVATVVGTAALCLFMYRQSQLLRFQILAQETAIKEAQQQWAPMAELLPVFQRIGGRHPDYAAQVLKRFQLDPIPATNVTGSGRP